MVLNRGNFVPQGTWAMSEDNFGCHNLVGEGDVCYWHLLHRVPLSSIAINRNTKQKKLNWGLQICYKSLD